MIDIKTGVRLSKEEVLNLLVYFDDSSEHPLHDGLDFETYSIKLSQYANFILAYSSGKYVGFIAYYLNTEGKFVYIPQIVVHKSKRHQGVGHCMFGALVSRYSIAYSTVKLEVLRENMNAINFYTREGFTKIEDREERLYLEKELGG